MMDIETTLYDKYGSPVAYLSDDMATIYLWSGDAVASIVAGRVYGLVGKHLGWFDNGVMYDLMDHQVGFTRHTCPVAPLPEPPKPAKRTRFIAMPRSAPIARSFPEQTLSHMDLATFLNIGTLRYR